MKQWDVLLFMGPPGSGKGSLAQACVRRLGWKQISTGDLCRQHIKRGTEIGAKIDLMIKSGKLIPDDLITSMVQEWLAEHSDFDSTVLLDGYPRNIAQAEAFDVLIKSKPAPFHFAVIHFVIDDDVVVKRLSNRQVCQNKECQAVYSVDPNSMLLPKKAGICDRCGYAVVRREDDEPDVIRHRLNVYHRHEQALLNFYKKKNCSIYEIDGNKSFAEIVLQFKQKVNVQEL